MTREEKEAMKDKAIHDAMCSIENRVRHVYNQGYSDGLADGNINSGLFADKVREAYNNGLEDAWECARKILFDGSLSRDILTELGADSFCGVIHKCSSSEVIEKIKEYEEKQTEEKTEKNCKTCRYGNIPDCGIYPCNECKRATFSKWTPKQTEKSCNEVEICCDSQATRETENCKSCRFDWDNYEASGISYDVKHNHCIACDHSSGFEAINDDDRIKVGFPISIITKLKGLRT